MSSVAVFFRVRLPLAWPVIISGIRVSAQMSMGVAAIAAYALGPGLGSYIYTGLSQIGNANALNYALVGTIAVVVLALILDAVLALVGRLTTSKGIRA
jgi:osmoprotectant transport system permease protein